MEVETVPNIKSAKKRVKVIETKTLRNQMIKSNSVALCSEVYKKIDKAVAKGIFHKNTAARKKSLIATRLNKMA